MQEQSKQPPSLTSAVFLLLRLVLADAKKISKKDDKEKPTPSEKAKAKAKGKARGKAKS